MPQSEWSVPDMPFRFARLMADLSPACHAHPSRARGTQRMNGCQCRSTRRRSSRACAIRSARTMRPLRAQRAGRLLQLRQAAPCRTSTTRAGSNALSRAACAPTLSPSAWGCLSLASLSLPALSLPALSLPADGLSARSGTPGLRATGFPCRVRPMQRFDARACSLSHHASLFEVE